MTNRQIPKLVEKITENQEAFEGLLTVAQAQAIINNPRSFIETACAAWRRGPDSIHSFIDQLTEWRRFYSEVFGFTDTESLNPSLSVEASGFNWLIVVRKGLTLNRVLEVMRTKFKVYSYIGDNLDKGVPTNDRNSEKDYAISIRDRVEADEENKNLSANQIKEKNIISMTLLERLLLELFYFWKTKGEHMDIKNATLCSGSRLSGGHVPYVNWNPDNRGVQIDWYGAYGSGDGLRARAAVVG